MSFRDTVQEWIDKGFTPKASNPLVSKRLVQKNLKEILSLLDSDCPKMASERIKWLIDDIDNDKLKAGEL
jgi:hypothetical protein